MIQLDNQQKAAVYTDSHSALVLAGAGSGKTRVLTERIGYLVEEKQVTPYHILAFTFTRKAAGEMKGRLEKRIGNAAFNLSVGTMHGFGLDIVQRFGEAIGLHARHATTVYSEWETTYLLRDVAMEMGYYKKSWKGLRKKDIDELFYDYYTAGKEPDPLHVAYNLFQGFRRRCQENNALTYGDILICLKKLIPYISKHMRFEYIFVDEVQDNDPLQWEIVNTMCEAFDAKLFAVGDLDQSIYEFRGAVPGYLLEHQGEFDLFKIESNYRSRAPIVEAANSLIEHNNDRLDKTMVPVRPGEGVDVEWIPDTDSGAIAENLALSIAQATAGVGGVLPQDMAVIARSHFLLKKTAELLKEAGVNYEYVGEKSELTNSEEFRRFHAFLKLMVNPYDNFSFLLVRDLIGLDGKQYANIRVISAQAGKSHFQTWIDTAEWPYKELFDNPTDSLALAVWQVHYAAIGSYPFPDAGWNFGNEEEIFRFICGWIADGNNHGTAEQYLEYLATYDIQDEIADEPEGVQLLTIHAAKGLEFPAVIVAGCNEGILPSKRSLKEDGGLEAERRLGYVAWTRAEDTLILTSRPLDEDEGNPPSRFLAESGI